MRDLLAQWGLVVLGMAALVFLALLFKVVGNIRRLGRDQRASGGDHDGPGAAR